MKAIQYIDGRACHCAAWLLCLFAVWAVAAEGGTDASDDREVAAFCDEFFARQMKELDIPGAVVVWVRDGKLRHARGYGVANRETGAAVDFERTVFRTASVSKFFTALCALRLAEEGKLDLKADLNDYLDDMQVGSAALGTVTPSSLIVHTGGFDERLLGYLTRDPPRVADLGGYLRTWMPPQTRRAGQLATYSNHGYALLGYLVERQSGMRFDAYARERFFAPLGMQTTAFLVPPVGPHIESGLCPGYWASGELVEPVWSRPYPAGALATSGADMARFMGAFLAAVRGEPSETFPASVVRRLTTRHFSHRPDTPGYTLGLAEMELFGHRVLLKGGSAPGHSAVIALLPDRDAGLFVAVNRQEPQFWTRLLPELVAHEFPKAARPPAQPTEARPLDRFAGEYRAMRYANRSFERVLSLAMHLRVAAVDGQLHLSGPDLDLLCQPTAEPLVFSSEPGRYVAFREDDSGRIELMFLNVLGDHLAAERLGFWQRADAVAFTVLGAVLVLLAGGALAALGPIWRRVSRGTFRTTEGALMPLLSVGLALAIVATVAAFYRALVPLTHFLYGPSLAIWLALIGTNLMALLAIALLIVAGRRLLGRRTDPLRRAVSGVLCGACIVVVAFLVQFNLIGFQL